MLIEVKDHREDLQVGDLTYYKGTLLKVARRYENKDGDVRTVKFRKIGRLKLTEWVPPAPALIPEFYKPKQRGGIVTTRYGLKRVQSPQRSGQ